MIPIEAFDRPIAFHRIFAQIAGCPYSGLFLSYLWELTGDSIIEDKWIKISEQQIENEILLSKKQRRKSMQKLNALGILIVSDFSSEFVRIDNKALNSLVEKYLRGTCNER